MKPKTAAILTSRGIGDGLMMMIPAHHLHKKGYVVTMFHDELRELASWFPGQLIEKKPPHSSLEKILSSFDLVLMQNENTERATFVRDLYQRGKLKNLSIFYASHEEEKHPPPTTWDFVFDAHKTMTHNIAHAVSKLLGFEHPSKENGISIPNHLTYRKHLKRVVIHPTTSELEREWPQKKYIQLAKLIRKIGYEPMFVMSPKDREQWLKQVNFQFAIPLFATLADVAEFIYESGFMIGNDSAIGHLSSNLGIPQLIISNNYKRMNMWRPGWKEGRVVTPFRFIPNPKKFRFRLKLWKLWVTPFQVFYTFYQMLKEENLV